MSRPSAVTYDKTKCLAAKVKPKQQKVSEKIYIALWLVFGLKTFVFVYTVGYHTSFLIK